jgi:hypothetical protein
MTHKYLIRPGAKQRVGKSFVWLHSLHGNIKEIAGLEAQGQQAAVVISTRARAMHRASISHSVATTTRIRVNKRKRQAAARLPRRFVHLLHKRNQLTQSRIRPAKYI